MSPLTANAPFPVFPAFPAAGHLLLPADSVDPSARVPGPPDEAERARRRPTPMWQAVLLAALLHLWLALLLGNVPPGSAAPGQGLWGAINLRLQGVGAAAPAAELLPPIEPLPATGPPGDAPSERAGGVVRQQAPAPQTEPGAAQRGDWAALVAPPAFQGGPNLSNTDLTGPAAVQEPPALIDLPSLTERPAARLAPDLAPDHLLSERRSALPALPPSDRAADVAARWPEAPALPALADAPVPPPLRAPPVAAVRPGLPETPPASLAPNLGLPDLPGPALAPLPVLAASPAAGAAPLANPAAMSPLPPVTPWAAATGAAGMPALQNLPALAVPDAPTARLAEPPGPQRVNPALQPLTTSEAAAPMPVPGTAGLAALPELGAAPLAAPVPSGAGAPAGRPDAGSREGADVATPPSAPASTPRLNLQLPRARGGELSRLGGSGLLPVLPRPPELKSKLEREIEGAAIPDCRTAHAKLGLLAVVPLALDALKKDGGCRW